MTTRFRNKRIERNGSNQPDKEERRETRGIIERRQTPLKKSKRLFCFSSIDRIDGEKRGEKKIREETKTTLMLIIFFFSVLRTGEIKEVQRKDR